MKASLVAQSNVPYDAQLQVAGQLHIDAERGVADFGAVGVLEVIGPIEIVGTKQNRLSAWRPCRAARLKKGLAALIVSVCAGAATRISSWRSEYRTSPQT